MKKSIRSLFALSCLLTSASAWAGKMPEAKVDYEADGVMEVQGMTMTSHIYSSPGKQRQEMGTGGVTMITRRDKGLLWNLQGGNQYMESKLNADDPRDMANMDMEQTRVGEETVNGVPTTKYKLIATTKDGKKYGGFSWVTSQGVVVKADMLLKDGTRTDRIHMELNNLKVGRVDPKKFEIPPGYTKNDMATVTGYGMPNAAARQSGPRQANPQGQRRVPPNMQEMMKRAQEGQNMSEEDIKKMMGQ